MLPICRESSADAIKPRPDKCSDEQHERSADEGDTQPSIVTLSIEAIYAGQCPFGRGEHTASITTTHSPPSAAVLAGEWQSMTTDALLAQSAIDRLASSAHTLVIEDPSYR